MKLPLTYYLSDDVKELAKSFLGKFLISNINGHITGGMITETEAYEGVTDKASHAYNGLRSNRTEIMYSPGGVSYVYLCYGIHNLFNIVTNEINIPHAILVRGIFPMFGIKEMLRRSGKERYGYNLTNGPGKLTKALGITIKQNGLLLNGNVIWIENRGIDCKASDITAGSRIGIDYAGDDAFLPYRFILDYRNYIV